MRWRTGALDLSMALNGALAGLVAITAGCDVIRPAEGMLVGAIGGILVVEAVLWLDRVRVDDPVGAVPVHLVNGVFGTIAVGLFASKGDALGLFHGGGFQLLGVQCAGVAMSALFAFVTGGATWLLLKRLPGGVRVSRDHELEGLDLAECGIEAYNEDDRTVGHSLNDALGSPG